MNPSTSERSADLVLHGTAAWVVPLAVLIGSMVALYLLRGALYRWLSRRAAKTSTRVDDLVVSVTRLPSHLWVLCTSILIAIRTVPLPGGIEPLMHRILVAVLILSATMVLARFLAEFVQHYSSQPGIAPATTGVTRIVVQAVVILIGMLVFLGSLGINIAPLLGALGVGGLAVGLALQPTLSNLFAGFQIAMVRQIRPGHRIALDSGQEGYVTDISWRTTTLRTPSNHLIIIPNSRLAESIVVNYDMPDRPVNIPLTIGVSYDSTTREVQEVLEDEVRKLRDELPGMVRDFEPIVRFQSFGDFSLNFLVILRVQSFDEQFAIWGEIHHRIFERLQREGIEIPFPVRTVHLRGEPLAALGRLGGGAVER